MVRVDTREESSTTSSLILPLRGRIKEEVVEDCMKMDGGRPSIIQLLEIDTFHRPPPNLSIQVT